MILGVYGSGMIATVLVSNYKEVEGLTIKAITDVPQADAHVCSLCEKYGIPEHHHDVNAMLQDSEIDTVYVAVPNSLHYEYSKRALLAGKHVICEKPFTSNDREAQELADIAREKDLILVEAVNTHYEPNTQKIKERIPSVGDVKMVVMNYSSYSSRYDKFKEGVVLPVFDPKMSGGALMDANIYNLHFMAHMFGEPKDIVYYPNMARGIDTSGVCVLDYGDFKCVAVGTKDSKGPVSVSIEGDKGYVYFPYTVNALNGFTFRESMGKGVAHEGDEKMENYNGKHFHMYYEFVEFVRMVREHDREAADKMLDLSLIVSRMQSKARRQAGIWFEADRNV